MAELNKAGGIDFSHDELLVIELETMAKAGHEVERHIRRLKGKNPNWYPVLLQQLREPKSELRRNVFGCIGTGNRLFQLLEQEMKNDGS